MFITYSRLKYIYCEGPPACQQTGEGLYMLCRFSSLLVDWRRMFICCVSSPACQQTGEGLYMLCRFSSMLVDWRRMFICCIGSPACWQTVEGCLYVVRALQHVGKSEKDFYTVKPFIKNTSEEFIKCRLDNFSMSFILYYGQIQYLRK